MSKNSTQITQKSLFKHKNKIETEHLQIKQYYIQNHSSLQMQVVQLFIYVLYCGYVASKSQLLYYCYVYIDILFNVL